MHATDRTEEYRAVLDALDPHIALLDRSGTIVAVNAAWTRFAQSNGGDGSGTSVGINYLEASCAPTTVDPFALAAQEGITQVLAGARSSFAMEYPCHAPDEERWFVLDARPLDDANGGAIVIHTNVTEVHVAQAEVRRQERHFASLIEHAADLITVMDVDGTISYRSPALEHMLGYSATEAVGANGFAILHPDDVEIARRAMADIVTVPTGTACHEVRMRHRDGSWRWTEATLTNLLDIPDVGGLVVNVRDITERKAAAVTIAERAESFSTLFHGTAEAMVIHDGQAFVAVNRAYADMIGLDAEQLAGRALLDFVAPVSHALAIERMHQGSEVPYDLTARRADGSTFPVELLGRRIRFEDRWLRLLTVRDVTQRRQTEEALRASEARQSLLLRLMQRQRETDDPAALIASASEALGRHIKANRAGFFETFSDDTLTFVGCWTDGTLEPQVGSYPVGIFQAGWRDEAFANRTFSVTDLSDPQTANLTFDAAGARAGIGAPIIRGGRWRAGLYVNQSTLREWTADEIALVRKIADLTWDAVERVRAEGALRESEARFRALVQEASDIVIVYDPGGCLQYANPALERVLGHPNESYAAGLRLDIVHPDDRESVVQTWTAVTESPGAQFRITYRCLNADNAWVWLEGIATNLIDLPAVGGVVLNARDASEQKRLESELRHLALHDPLTGIPNRTLLADRMDYALLQAAHLGHQVAILFLDLDFFKQVNDAFGHAAGDDLLRSVTARLTSALRATETIARVGGDEFVVLLPRIAHEREAREVAEQIRAMMAAPFVWQGREVTAVGVTIGFAIAQDGTVQSDALLRDGDAALYSAKRAGRGSAIVHRTGMSGHAERRWALKTGLRDAAGRGEFVLHYQPIVDLATGHVGRVEALIRWHHPVFGLVPPNEFIPIAEEAGHILSVGRWVIEEVCRQLRQWGSGTPAIAINLPTAQFTDPELARDIGTAMARFGIDPRMLWVEITEHMLVDDLPATVSTLNQLRKLGVSMAIDDFGTGYSSLRYLRELPVDSIKLDRSFVHGLESSPGALAIVEGITSLAHAIGLTVTAEGIETVGQLTRLRAIGCDRGQGFYLARPAPADEHPPAVTLLLPGSALSGVIAGR